MRIARLTGKSTLIAAAVLLGAAEAPAAEKLGDLTRKSGWDRVVGTWVDADTKGAAYKATYPVEDPGSGDRGQDRGGEQANGLTDGGQRP